MLHMPHTKKARVSAIAIDELVGRNPHMFISGNAVLKCINASVIDGDFELHPQESVLSLGILIQSLNVIRESKQSMVSSRISPRRITGIG